jgi:hypothetical protein
MPISTFMKAVPTQQNSRLAKMWLQPCSRLFAFRYRIFVKQTLSATFFRNSLISFFTFCTRIIIQNSACEMYFLRFTSRIPQPGIQ